MRQHMKRLIAFMLTLITMIISPLSNLAVYATTTGIGNSDSTTGGGGYEGDNNSLNVSNQGYRFTVVDQNGKRVSNSVDVWYNGTPGENIGNASIYYFTNSKLEILSNSLELAETGKHLFYDATDFIRYLNTAREGRGYSVTEMPSVALTGPKLSAEPHGEELMSWILEGLSDGTSGTTTASNIKEVKYIETLADGSKKIYYSDGSVVIQPAYSSGSSGSSVTAKTWTCKNCGKTFTESSSDSSLYCNACWSASVKCSEAISALNSFVTNGPTSYTSLSQFKSEYNSKLASVKDLLLSYYGQGKISLAQYTNYLLSIAKITAIYSTQYTSVEAKNIKYASADSVIEKLFNWIDKTPLGAMPVYAATEGTQVGTLYDILNARTKNENIFKLDGSSEVVNGEYSDGTKSPMNILASNNYTLLVEPLVWFKPCNLSGAQVSYYIAGTVTNVVQWSTSSLNTIGYTGGGNVTWLRGSLIRALALDETHNFATRDTSAVGSSGSYLYGFDTLASTFGKSTYTMEENGKPEFSQLGTVATTIGFGVHCYYASVGVARSMTQTYDTDLIDEKGPAPDPAPLDNEDDYGAKSKKFKIHKYYENSNDNGVTHIPVANFHRSDNPHTVLIQDEIPVGYEVVDWFTSTKDIYPPNGNNPTDHAFQNYKDAYNDGDYSYNGSTNRLATVTVLPEDDEVILHVLLRQKTPNRVDVVKVYEGTNGETDNVRVYTDVEVPNNAYIVTTPDSGYEHVNNSNTTAELTSVPESWSEVPKTNLSTDTVIKITDDTKTIYIHYKKDEYGASRLVLYQNEISRNYDLTSLTSSGELLGIARAFNKVPHFYCDHEEWVDTSSSGSDEDGNTWEDSSGYWDTCGNKTSRNYSNSNYYYTVKNDTTYDKLLIYQNQVSDTSVNGTASEPDGFDGDKVHPNIKFTLQRTSTDKVTLYPEKNSGSLKSVLNDMGITKESYQGGKTRYNSLEESEELEWFKTFHTNWVYETYGNPDGNYYCSSHGDRGSWTQSSKDSTANSVAAANSTYSTNNNISILGFIGSHGEGLNVPERRAEPFSIFGKLFNKNTANYIQKQDTNFHFYPYINMKMETLTTSKSDVKVTSENHSKVANISNTDVAVYYSKSGDSLLLESTQWSMHARSQAALSNFSLNDRDSILPGGAIYDLKGSNVNSSVPETWVGFRTFEMATPKAETLVSSTGISTTEQAKANGQTFANDVKNSLDNYQIVQWVAPGILGESGMLSHSKNTLVSGVGKASKFMDNTLSTADKYYLKVGTTNANRADIDILNSQFEQIIYNISSDTNGNVTVTKNGTALVSSKLDKDKNITALLSNSEVALLEQKTGVVSNYVSSLDFGLGTDVNTSTWYNEAYVGIDVVQTNIAYQLGFGDNGHSVRSAALDTKLTGYLKDRRDLYNFDKATLEEKTRTSQFRTSKKSTANPSSADGFMGNFNGTPIMMPNVDSLLKTKVFYIPNANVTDLN